MASAVGDRRAGATSREVAPAHVARRSGGAVSPCQRSACTTQAHRTFFTMTYPPGRSLATNVGTSDATDQVRAASTRVAAAAVAVLVPRNQPAVGCGCVTLRGEAVEDTVGHAMYELHVDTFLRACFRRCIHRSRPKGGTSPAVRVECVESRETRTIGGAAAAMVGDPALDGRRMSTSSWRDPSDCR